MSLFKYFANLLRRKGSKSRAPSDLVMLDWLSGLPESSLPDFVQESAVAMKYIRLLGPIHWSGFPLSPGVRIWPEITPTPLTTLAASYIVKVNEHLEYTTDWRQYLVEHPALTWALGFPLNIRRFPLTSADVDASLPTHRHFSRLMREMPNAPLQYLLDETVRLIQAELEGIYPNFGDCISLDTKHIVGWVKENNPKVYVEGGRYHKDRQPAGDPDCRLGCKRKHNQTKKGEKPADAEQIKGANKQTGEFYWGYASGVVATKAGQWGEFVLAELTKPFDQSDISFFFPLADETERRRGRKPHYGAFDAAFDAWYVYAYFHDADPEHPGLAAVPFVERGGYKDRKFSKDGLPHCEANLPMPVKYLFTDRSSLVEHEAARHVCPLLFPEPNGKMCPVGNKNWPKGGCTTTLPTSIGARLRYQIDRSGELYKQVYRQRTATERINSQAVDLDIERPKLRNIISIANQNTLTYVLINLHALQRLRQRKAETAQVTAQRSPEDPPEDVPA